MSLWNFAISLEVHTALVPRRTISTSSPSWEPQNFLYFWVGIYVSPSVTGRYRTATKQTWALFLRNVQQQFQYFSTVYSKKNPERRSGTSTSIQMNLLSTEFHNMVCFVPSHPWSANVQVTLVIHAFVILVFAFLRCYCSIMGSIIIRSAAMLEAAARSLSLSRPSILTTETTN
jgi:hypothetical protein